MDGDEEGQAVRSLQAPPDEEIGKSGHDPHMQAGDGEEMSYTGNHKIFLERRSNLPPVSQDHG
jgi:hypothetical protein